MSVSTCKCPACDSNNHIGFFSIENAPVHSILLIRNRQEALSFPTGQIDLSLCHDCGFVFNRLFDSGLQNYSEDCEETQGFSPTFSAFHKKLAQEVVERFNLHGKTVLEIGCGKGEFLAMLCDMGNNKGIGFDPAFRKDRLEIPTGTDLKVLQEFYPEHYTLETPDFICCKMTLEHIPDVLAFMEIVRASLKNNYNVPVFFQIPEVSRVFGDIAFWDVYYEHCSYFTKGSLGRLFRKAGFRVKDLWTAYDDQYLMVEAYPSEREENEPHAEEESVSEMIAVIENYKAKIEIEKQRWKEYIELGAAGGLKTIMWGGGSKAVAFLTTMGISDEIQYAVDINPHRQGTFLAGTGHEIVSPSFLTEYKPDRVIIMNSIYRDEIGKSLSELGLSPEIVTVDPES